MTPAIRKQIERSNRKSRGEKRVEVYLTAEEFKALDSCRAAWGLGNASDAIKSMIAPHIPKPGEPLF